MEKEKESGAQARETGLVRWLPYFWMALGISMAAIGGTIKVRTVIKLPELFEFLFFSGSAYVLMVSGLLVVILAIGHGLLFGDQE